MATITTTPGTNFAATLPTIRQAFEALRAQEDQVHASQQQTPEVLSRRIAVAEQAWQRLEAGLAQWANLLSMVRDTVRDMVITTQPIAVAAFASLDPLLQNDIPSPDWESAKQHPSEQVFSDSCRDAVEHLERRLALLTQFAVSCQMLTVQAGQGIPEEFVSLLSPPFRALQTPGVAVASAQPAPLTTPSMAMLPSLPQQGAAPGLGRKQTFAPAGKAAEVVEGIQGQIQGKDDRASMAAARQAQALKTLLERWTAPEEWASLSEEERSRRSSLMQSLWDRAQHLGRNVDNQS